MPVRLLRHQQLPPGVRVEHAVELRDRHVFHVREALDARVRDDDVEAAEVLLGLVEERGDLRRVRDVGRDGDAVAAQGFDLLDDGVGGGGRVRVVDDDVGAAARELEREDAALAAAWGQGKEALVETL